MNHHPIILGGNEDRIIEWANAWKPGDALPYPAFIHDLRKVLDSRFMALHNLKEAQDLLVKHGLHHMQ